MNETLRRIPHAESIHIGPRLYSTRSYLSSAFSPARLQSVRRAVGWSPTIALSWLWGLGFFYSLHVTLEDGWLGFMCFAGPNAVGLFAFGLILGSKKLNISEIMATLRVKYCGLFLLAQLLALAVTMFCFSAYLWQPLFGSNAHIIIGVVIIAGCAIGQVSSVKTLKRLHCFYLPMGVGAAFLALAALHAPSVPSAPEVLDSRYTGLLAPIVIGLLLGPWTDIQQWQRAVEIRRDGGSIRAAYGIASVMFFAMLTLNAYLAVKAGPVGQIVSSDGIANKAPAVALALATTGLGAAAYAAWASIAAISTIDSSYVALRWMMKTITASSNSPLYAFVSPKMLSSPIWIVLAAIALASAALIQNLSMMYLMAPFGTVMLGPAVSLVAESLGVRGRSDLTFSYLMGSAGALVLLEGYVNNIPALETAAPLIALIGCAPALSGVLDKTSRKPSIEQQDERPATIANGVEHIKLAPGSLSPTSSFDGQWFQMRLTPTYDDTNAVGNIYFANYIRWVGKARELFFNECMPNFDLSTTTYYVLTRSFRHEFRREAKEFEDVVVRLSIAEHNRKFVTLRHEIISLGRGMLGRGEQSLMFVDTKSFQPLDVPRSIIEGFLPFWPKTSPLAVVRDVTAIDAAEANRVSGTS